MPFYALTDYLFKVTRDIPLQAKLLRHGKLKREQRNQSKSKEKQLFSTWEDYAMEKMDGKELLTQLILVLRLKPLTEDMYLNDELDYDRFITDAS